jgi:hypothetical protein
MPKQIQIGYDKVPAPVTKRFPQLIDIEGIPLTDVAGNPLLTEEEAILGSFARAESALSTVAANKGKAQALPVVEVFPSESEVSSSLLGIPRAEEALSLFSDVSTYGLDEDNWNYYTFNGGGRDPGEWYRKENLNYGRRRFPNFNEGTEEQALYLESFPTQYEFPVGPFQGKTLNPSGSFKDYMNFIAMGKVLYAKYAGGAASSFAKKYFLNDDIKIVGADEIPINIAPPDTDYSYSGEPRGASEFSFVTGDEANNFMLQAGSYFDVDYGDNLQSSFDQIERWTQLFQEIVDDVAQFPDEFTGGSQRYVDSSEFKAVRAFCTQKSRPGGSSQAESFAILESKKTFRYQPGRVSGFTFGVRLKADPSSSSNYIEWGCSNESDEYMLQLVGSRLNIVRRSVIPFPQDILRNRFGLQASDQKLKYPVGLGNENPLYETIFERRSWNGDKLDGSGPSGYILSFENVTMYKIEFSWYGAIGAKFYAYVPSGNGEARWVLMHTLVIENGIEGPIMKNPDMKFKYLLYTANNERVKEPVYIFKYGSSYYIDGGDEGTINLSTFTTDGKSFLNRTPIIGVLPKEKIFNRDGVGNSNYKKGYPDTISVSVTEDVRIDIEEVVGSPTGQHFIFQPSIQANLHPFSRTLPFIFGSAPVTSLPGNPLDPDDQDFADDGTIGLREGEIPNIVNNADFVFNDGNEITNAGLNLGELFQIGDEILVEDTTSSNDGIYLIIGYDNTGGKDALLVRYNNPSSFTANNFPGDQSTTADAGQNGGVNIKSTGIKPSENNAKLIGDGIYNIHVSAEGAVVSDQIISSDILRRDSSFNLAQGNIDKLLKVDGETIVEKGTRFDARVASYNTIVASDVPINANEFIVHFMVPGRRDQQYGRHYADFGITFSSSKPYSVNCENGEQRLLFGDFGNEKEINLTEYPFVEYSHSAAAFDIQTNAEYTEWEPSEGERFMIDYRYATPAGGNSGYQAAIKGRVTFTDYGINVEASARVETDPVGVYRLRFSNAGNYPSDSLLDTVDTEIDVNNLGSEVGVGTLGTGWFYYGTSLSVGDGNRYIRIYKSGAVEEDFTELKDAISATAIDGNPGTVQTKELTLEDMWQVSSFPSGVEVDPVSPPERRFTSQEFTVSRALRFNSQPFYLVLAMKDYAQINNISVEEINPEGRSTHTPNFITGTTESQELFYDLFGNSATTNPPSNFVSDTRLSGLRYDSQTQNPLRPGTVLYSFYVAANKPETFRLNNIFNFDRKFLTRGLLNNKAIFFTATSVDGNAGQIEMGLTSREQ